MGTPGEVGAEPGLPIRLRLLSHRDLRTRSALTLNHGNHAAPAGGGLGHT